MAICSEDAMALWVGFLDAGMKVMVVVVVVVVVVG